MPTSDAISLFDAFADDLLAERNARPVVIVGASKVDDLLLEILRCTLLPKLSPGNNQDELLGGDTPLGTFSARIKICCRLGLIDPTLYKVLEQVRAIRNPSAHSISFDITKSPLREHLAELRKLLAPRSSFRLTKDRYFDGAMRGPIEELQCQLLTVCVLLEAIREKAVPTQGNKRAIKMAGK